LTGTFSSGHFVRGHFVRGHFVRGHFVRGHFVLVPILNISNDFLFLTRKIEDLIWKTLIGVNVNLSEFIVGNLDDEE
jgi:hypothetical protein